MADRSMSSPPNDDPLRASRFPQTIVLQFSEADMGKPKTNQSGLKQIACEQHQGLQDQKKETPTRILECPSHLSSLARQEWDRIVPELTAIGILSNADRAQLAIYCTAY